MMMVVNNNGKARPDLFSRGSLELTFRLLRDQNAQLALEVQNLLQGQKAEPQAIRQTYSTDDPFYKARRFPSDPAADHFYVTLSPQSVGKVVDTLTRLGQELLESSCRGNGKLLVIKTLMRDWINLAEWIILQVDTPPSQSCH
ncbi:hypothetical protein KOI40_13300 [Aestuariicella sp. G3-2]|uniref:hypothetical protein n=1 Tax=Pseudomaricurvus albidus TaxID=2842452 RepID=UPI001C0E24D7|nr:hypothetical protein [Aestuariicella albida]MBU3070802.1 hypothetical protein [Aestuariicella albida]